MGCKVTRGNDGSVAMISCSRNSGNNICDFCDSFKANKLCDYQEHWPDGKTCDARMCSDCATNHGEDKDFCPEHEVAYLAEVRR